MNLNALLSGILTFLVGSVLTFFVYREALINDFSRIEDRSQAAIDHLGDLLMTRIDIQADALERLARHIAFSGAVSEEQWNDDAAHLIDDFTGLGMLARTDKMGEVIWYRFDVDFSSDEIESYKSSQIQQYLRALSQGQSILAEKAFVRGPVEVSDGKIAFIMGAAIERAAKQSGLTARSGPSLEKGLIVTVLDVGRIFNILTKKALKVTDFDVVLSDKETQKVIYRHESKVMPRGRGIHLLPDAARKFFGLPEDLRLSRELAVFGRDWHLEIRPGQEFIILKRAKLAFDVLIGGMAFSSFGAFLVYLTQLLKRQKQLAEELSGSLKAVLDGSTRVSIVTTDLQGTIKLFNTGACRLLGYESSEVTGQKSALAFHLESELEAQMQLMGANSDAPADVFGALSQAASQGAYQEKNWTYIRKDGSRIPVNLIVTPIYTENVITGFLEMAIDVTETERQLRDYAEKLEIKNKELEEFNYVASHDLKEPLRNLISYSQLLEADLGQSLSSDVADDLKYIRDAAQRMRFLIDDLLQLSRAGSGVLTPTTLTFEELVNEASKGLVTRIKETGATIEILNKECEIIGDRTLLVQLFVNLMNNAMKFVAPGVLPRLKLSIFITNTHTTLEFADNGIGMKSEYLSQIFAPFKRLHGMGVYEGTGIGLSICRKIVERHGWQIWAESEPGNGSCFYVSMKRNSEAKVF